MNDNLIALAKAIAEKPDDDTAALVLADLLQENGAETLAATLRSAVWMKSKPKVYLVSTGDYSDYRVVGVFSSNKAAVAFMEVGNPRPRDFNEIETYQLDTEIDKIKAGLLPWDVRMALNGDHAAALLTDANHEESDYSYNDNSHPIPGVFYRCFCWAKDEKHAIKITNEKRIIWLERRNPLPTVGSPMGEKE